MTTTIERDSSCYAVALIFVVALLLAAGGLGFAYMNGQFGENSTVSENTKTVEKKTVILPAPAIPASAPSPAKPAQSPVQ